MKRKNLGIVAFLVILMLMSSLILLPASPVYAQTLSLTPTSGAPGTGITVTGSAFTGGAAGWVWFDSNGNSVRDATEPQVSVTTTAGGAIPSGTTLAVPSVAAGPYYVRADIPTGAPIEASASFTVLPAPSITLSPTSGAPGTGITITGSGFALSSGGVVWFDSNGNNAIDSGEPQVPVTTTAAGAIPSGITLAIPSVVPGIYSVRADIPTGAPIEASASFTVPTPGITLSSTSGTPGTVITITGSGFTPNTAGVVWFDSDGDNVRDGPPTEPEVSVTTTSAGAIPSGITLAVPSVAPSTYQVRADIPTGLTVEASASFTLLPIPSISLSSTSGTPGTVITITGSGFALNTAGWVWFDSNGDNVRDGSPTEPEVLVTTTTAGALPGGITLTVPTVAPGTYLVRADIPTGLSIEASATFTVAVLGISLSPTSGAPGTVITISGSGFTPNTAGVVWFDSNGDNVRDGPPTEPEVLVTTTTAGAIPSGVILAVPSVALGTYLVRADIPTGVTIEASASFTVLTPGISLSPTSGAPGTVTTVSGSGLTPNTAGWVWFDSDGDGVIDVGEPQASVTTTSAGAVPSGITLTVPTVAPGTYQVLADIPADGTAEASASFIVPTPSISLSTTSGASGTVTTVSGSGLTVNAAGWVWFDSNGDGVKDATEPQASVTTTSAGAIPSGITLTVPTVAPGTYQVQADIPTGSSVEASASFTVAVRAIALSPASGAPGTVITITGSGFVPNTTGWVWFDSNGDSVKDATEPQVSMTTTTAGFIPSGMTLTVPTAAAPQVYQVLGDIPIDPTVEASASFMVTPPSLPGLLLSSAIGDIILAPSTFVDVLAPGTLPFMGTIGIQSTGLRYHVDVWTGTVWNTVVGAGARNVSYPVSGFGLRITNDTTTTMTVSYVFVYLR